MARKKKTPVPPPEPQDSRLYVGSARIKKRGAGILGQKKKR